MIITCENCGKRHHIDPEQFREAMTTFQCDACKHIMTFSIRADNRGDLSTSEAEFIDVTEQDEEVTMPNPETKTGGSPEPHPTSRTLDDSEDIDWAEVIKEATPASPEAQGEEPERLDLTEQSEEATLLVSETASEESSEADLDETVPLSSEESEDLAMKKQSEEVTPSVLETKGEEPSESGLDEKWAFNTEEPEHLDLSEQNEEAALSAPEVQGEEPERLDLAEQDAESTPSASEAAREEASESAPSPLTSGDSEDIDWAEVIKEASPPTPEMTGEELPESGLDKTLPLSSEEPEDLDWAEQDAEMTASIPQPERKEESPRPAPRKREGPAMRGKMFSLFLVVPICLIIAAVFIHRNSMEKLTGFIITESTQLVTKMAEHAIAEKGRFVAAEVGRYLLSHPDLPKENFMQDPVLKGMGIQNVGATGYTYLISMRTPIEASALWLHPDEKLIGKNVIPIMRKALGDGYQGWNRIQGIAFTQGTEAAGYFTGPDKREKYMVMVPVEGTAFFVASTTYLDEFTKPLIALQGRVNELTAAAARIMTIVLIATALIIVLLFAINNYLLSGRLKSVPDAADYSDVDDLAVETGHTKGGNESKVAPAIRRMQGGIQHAIKRFRERK